MRIETGKNKMPLCFLRKTSRALRLKRFLNRKARGEDELMKRLLFRSRFALLSS
jgi:hypothetical protein